MVTSIDDDPTQQRPSRARRSGLRSADVNNTQKESKGNATDPKTRRQRKAAETTRSSAPAPASAAECAPADDGVSSTSNPADASVSVPCPVGERRKFKERDEASCTAAGNVISVTIESIINDDDSSINTTYDVVLPDGETRCLAKRDEENDEMLRLVGELRLPAPALGAPAAQDSSGGQQLHRPDPPVGKPGDANAMTMYSPELNCMRQRKQQEAQQSVPSPGSIDGHHGADHGDDTGNDGGSGISHARAESVTAGVEDHMTAKFEEGDKTTMLGWRDKNTEMFYDVTVVSVVPAVYVVMLRDGSCRFARVVYTDADDSFLEELPFPYGQKIQISSSDNPPAEAIDLTASPPIVNGAGPPATEQYHSKERTEQPVPFSFPPTPVSARAVGQSDGDDLSAVPQAGNSVYSGGNYRSHRPPPLFSIQTPSAAAASARASAALRHSPAAGQEPPHSPQQPQAPCISPGRALVLKGTEIFCSVQKFMLETMGYGDGSAAATRAFFEGYGSNIPDIIRSTYRSTFGSDDYGGSGEQVRHELDDNTAVSALEDGTVGRPSPSRRGELLQTNEDAPSPPESLELSGKVLRGVNTASDLWKLGPAKAATGKRKGKTLPVREIFDAIKRLASKEFNFFKSDRYQEVMEANGLSAAMFPGMLKQIDFGSHESKEQRNNIRAWWKAMMFGGYGDVSMIFDADCTLKARYNTLKSRYNAGVVKELVSEDGVLELFTVDERISVLEKLLEAAGTLDEVKRWDAMVKRKKKEMPKE